MPKEHPGGQPAPTERAPTPKATDPLLIPSPDRIAITPAQLRVIAARFDVGGDVYTALASAKGHLEKLSVSAGIFAEADKVEQLVTTIRTQGGSNLAAIRDACVRMARTLRDIAAMAEADETQRVAWSETVLGDIAAVNAELAAAKR